MTLKALGCSSLCGTISATVVRMMPTLPFPRPAKALATTAHGSDVEKPKRMLVVMVHIKPARMAGLRPNRSDIRPQMTPVRHWLREKTAEVMPAQYATLVLGTSKLSIISGCGDWFSLYWSTCNTRVTHEVGEDGGQGNYKLRSVVFACTSSR
jgi:hypothetical protein